MTYEKVVTEIATAIGLWATLAEKLPQFPKDGSEHYKWLVEQLKQQHNRLDSECVEAAKQLKQYMLKRSLEPIVSVAPIIPAIAFALSPSLFLFFLTGIFLIWYKYETKRTTQILQSLATYVEKKLQPQRLAAEGLLSRISQERESYSK